MVPIVGVFKVYIALLGAKMRDIAPHPFPKLVTFRPLVIVSSLSFPAKAILYFLCERLSTDSNTSSPFVVASIVAAPQGHIHPFFMGLPERFILILTAQLGHFFISNEHTLPTRRLNFVITPKVPSRGMIHDARTDHV